MKIFRQFGRISLEFRFVDSWIQRVNPEKNHTNPTSLLVESSSWYCLMVYWNPARVEHGRMLTDYIHWLFLMRCGLVGCLFILFISLISFRRLVPVPHLNLGCWYVGSHFVGYGYDDSKLLRFYGIRFRWYVASTPPTRGSKHIMYIQGVPNGSKKVSIHFTLVSHWRPLESAGTFLKPRFELQEGLKKHVFTKKQLQKKIIRYQLGFILI